MGLTQRLGTIPLAIQTDSSNNVGIGGTPSGSFKLEVTGASKLSGFLGVNGSPATSFPFEAYINSSTAYSSTSRGNVMRVYNSNTGANVFAGIELGGAGTANDGLAGLNAVVTGSGSAALTFYTRDGGTFAERFRVAANGNVGIANTNPIYKLDVHNGSDFDIRLRDTSLGGTVGILFETANDFSGTSQAYIKGIGAGNSGVSQLIFGTAGGSGDTTATERMRITSGGDVNIGAVVSAGNRFFVRGSSTSSGDTTIFAQNSAGTNLFYVRNNGTFYTGTAAESPYNLTIASSANVFVFSDGALFRATSSARYKKDIEDINVDTFGLINKIRPVWYRSTTGNDRNDWSWYGLIAEELAEVDPRFVHFGYAPEDYIKDEETGKTELKEGAELRADGVMYDRLTVLLIKGMQEQKKLIDELNAKVTALENK